ncbi:MAG: hypothetical protein ACRD15_09830, partial [Vicinamibacterales bacterium]
MHAFLAVIVLVTGFSVLPDAAAERQSLRDVLRRAGEYVVGYGESLATVIADERYTQQLVAHTGGAVLRSRVLRAEIVFVRLAGSEQWQAFRNVIEVDGEPVAGAEGRLERVMRGAPRSIAGQGRVIAEESARHNLGPLHRNFNASTMPLQFLDPSHQDRFRFDKRSEEMAGAERVWRVRFRERRRGTMIRNPEGGDVPVEGLLWIAPDDGRVVRASFFVTDFLPANRGPKTSRADLEVTWQPNQKLDLWVPAEMRERYSGPWVE